MTNQTLSQAISGHAALTPDGDRAVTLGDLKLTFEASTGSLLLVAHRASPAALLLAPESDYTRRADSLGVSQESKIGCEEFDRKYVIRDNSGKAKAMLTPAVVALVQSLEPFIELEFCDDMIRLLKKPTDEAAAVNDMENLAKLAQAL